MARLIRVALSPLEAGETALAGAAFRYVCRVHRLAASDQFIAFDPDAGLEARATLLRVERDQALCRVEQPQPAAAQRLDVTLIYGLAKGDKVDQVVRDATALGVTRILLTSMERSVVRLAGARAEQRHSRWHSIAVESARQCGRRDVPEIAGPLEYSEAIERAALRAGLLLCCDPTAVNGLGVLLEGWEPSSHVALIVGPEGGLAPREIEAALERGFVPARLGNLALRTETAAVAVLAVVLSRV